MHRPLCPTAHCAIRHRHNPDCPNPDHCRGCLPRPAADGLHLCWVCTRRIGEDALQLAALHRDLTHALIRRGRSEHISGSSDPSKAPDGEVIERRRDIEATLARLCALIARERGISPPEPEVLDLARFVAGHREWLAAHRDAAEHATDLRALAADRRVWALAYASGSDRLYIGDCPLTLVDLEGNESVCGTRLYQHADELLLTCPGCLHQDTVEWWQRQIVGDARGEVDCYAAAAWLSLRWYRPVDPALIRQWASRGKVEPVMETVLGPDGKPKARPKRDARGRVLYELAALREYAESIWGPPAYLRRAA